MTVISGSLSSARTSSDFNILAQSNVGTDTEVRNEKCPNFPTLPLTLNDPHNSQNFLEMRFAFVFWRRISNFWQRPSIFLPPWNLHIFDKYHETKLVI